MTIYDFLDWALDDFMQVIIYDFATDSEIWSGTADEAKDNYSNLAICSWEVNNNTITINIDSDNE